MLYASAYFFNFPNAIVFSFPLPAAVTDILCQVSSSQKCRNRRTAQEIYAISTHVHRIVTRILSATGHQSLEIRAAVTIGVT
jgi:hypothetical protein